jgi:hypothetical protein
MSMSETYNFIFNNNDLDFINQIKNLLHFLSLNEVKNYYFDGNLFSKKPIYFKNSSYDYSSKYKDYVLKIIQEFIKNYNQPIKNYKGYERIKSLNLVSELNESKKNNLFFVKEWKESIIDDLNDEERKKYNENVENCKKLFLDDKYLNILSNDDKKMVKDLFEATIIKENVIDNENKIVRTKIDNIVEERKDIEDIEENVIYQTPDSFSFIATQNVAFESIGMLLSLSLYHPDALVYGLVDSKTKEEIENTTPKIKLNLKLFATLDKYSNKDRQEMEKENIWAEFQMQKAEVIKFALVNCKDTLFLDSDIIFFNPINCIDKSKELALSPHYMKKSESDIWGFFNGGLLWTKNMNVVYDWIEFTKNSRFFDQASLEDLANKYDYQELGREINFTPWRIIHLENDEERKEVIESINTNNNNINYNDKPLVCFHTHFHSSQFQQINNFIINKLGELRRYKDIMLIWRIINKKWVIKIPSQPRENIWKHTNDSFRELAYLYKENNNDVDIQVLDNTNHCWLYPNILFYDRPNHEWFNEELGGTFKMLMGNGSMELEGKFLKDNGVNVSPWIFWPRNPRLLESLLSSYTYLTFNERTIESIFIGNFENNVQAQYRQNNEEWKEVLTDYHCTAGKQHKFNKEQYLLKLRSAKYGLCLRGFGSKCHREVELMAFGTVPIITPHVEIISYINPPQENIHYIRANSPEDYENKIENISEEKWNEMSKACVEWYEKNVHSKNSWKTTIDYLLYN